jgi:hypothetical protein
MAGKSVPYHKHRARSGQFSRKSRLKMAVACYDRQAGEKKISLPPAPWDNETTEVSLANGPERKTNTR